MGSVEYDTAQYYKKLDEDAWFGDAVEKEQSRLSSNLEDFTDSLNDEGAVTFSDDDDFTEYLISIIFEAYTGDKHWKERVDAVLNRVATENVTLADEARADSAALEVYS